LIGLALGGEGTVDEGEESLRGVWTGTALVANLTLCSLGCWRNFANNYLHWAALVTWLVLNLQGK
jgi:hypothetical protein